MLGPDSDLDRGSWFARTGIVRLSGPATRDEGDASTQLRDSSFRQCPTSTRSEPRMSNELESRIRRIEDHQAITNLQATYSFLVDSFRFDELVELFEDDLVWEVGFDRMMTVTSKPALLEVLRKTEESTAMMVHMLTTPLIEIDGDRATGSWYLFGMVTSKTPDGEAARWVHGRYDNAYARVGEQWKISRLSYRYTFLTPYDEGWAKTPMAPLWQ